MVSKFEQAIDNHIAEMKDELVKSTPITDRLAERPLGHDGGQFKPIGQYIVGVGQCGINRPQQLPAIGRRKSRSREIKID